MATFFKELTSTEEPRDTWSFIHPTGRLAILAQGEPANREEFLRLLDTLRERPPCAPAKLKQFVAELTAAAPWLARGSGLAVLVHDDSNVAWEASAPASVVCIPMKSEPVALVAQSKLVPISVEYSYVLVSEQLDSAALKHADIDQEGESPASLARGIATATRAKAWRAFVYPAESQLGFINPAWRRNPFVGFQEGRPWEKKGLRFLADELDRSDDFRGFWIIGGPHFITRLDPDKRPPGVADDRTPGSRLADGLLVCPMGLFLLELKEWAGEIELEVQNRNHALRQIRGKSDTNPVFKLEEAMRDLKDFNFGVRFSEPPQLGGLVLFTHPRGRVTCIDAAGKRYPLPYNSAGKVLIGTPHSAPKQIRDFARKVHALKLTTSDLDSIAEHLGPRRGSAPSKNAQVTSRPQTLQLGSFRISLQPLEDESTAYCQVFEAHKDEQSRVLWAKRYALTTMARSDEGEIARVAREVSALQDLSSEPGFYRYLDRFRDGLDLYVIVERVPGVKLDQWILTEAPSRERRLGVLKQVAALLSKLAERRIVHRAIRPASVRVGEGDRVNLVNFDLCQLVSLATVDARGRTQLDHAYLSLAAATPGVKLSPADDSFSFGKLACKTLTDTLPFLEPGTDAAFFARPALWQEFATKTGLSEREIAGIKQMLARDPQQRPVGDALVAVVDGWLT